MRTGITLKGHVLHFELGGRTFDVVYHNACGTRVATLLEAQGLRVVPMGPAVMEDGEPCNFADCPAR